MENCHYGPIWPYSNDPRYENPLKTSTLREIEALPADKQLFSNR